MGDSDDDTIVLPKQVQRIESKITDEEISRLTVTCSACNEKISFRKLSHFKKHIHLSVLVCKKCFDFYDDGNFSRDETGDKYCRWCADGGRLIACDNCTNAFCVKCIRRNTGNKGLNTITGKEDWKCFICDPTPLKLHVKFCKRILKYVKYQNKRREVDNLVVNLSDSDSDSPSSKNDWRTNSWVGPLLVEAENAIVVLNRRMARVKRKLGHNSSKVNKCALRLKGLLSKHHQFIEYLLVDVKDALEAHSVTETTEQIENETAPDKTEENDSYLLRDEVGEDGVKSRSEMHLPSEDALDNQSATAKCFTGSSTVSDSNEPVQHDKESEVPPDVKCEVGNDGDDEEGIDGMVVTLLPDESNDKADELEVLEDANDKELKSRISPVGDLQGNCEPPDKDETINLEEGDSGKPDDGNTEPETVISDNHEHSGDTKSDVCKNVKQTEQLTSEDLDHENKENSEVDTPVYSNKRKNKLARPKYEDVSEEKDNKLRKSKRNLGKLDDNFKPSRKSKQGHENDMEESEESVDENENNLEDAESDKEELESKTKDVEKDVEERENDMENTIVAENHKEDDDMDNAENTMEDVENSIENVENHKEDDDMDDAENPMEDVENSIEHVENHIEDDDMDNAENNMKKSRTAKKKQEKSTQKINLEKTNSGKSDNDLESSSALELEFSSSDSEDMNTKDVKLAVGSYLEQTVKHEDQSENDNKKTATKIKTEVVENEGQNVHVKSMSEKGCSDEENERAKKSLLSDLFLSTPQKKRKRKRSISSNSSLSSGDSNTGGENQVTFSHPDIEKDEKLRCETRVILERLDIPDKDLKEKLQEKQIRKRLRKKHTEMPEEITLDEEISRLSALPNRNKVSGKSKSVFSDSSGSDFEFELKNVRRKITPRKKAKPAIVLSSDSDDDDDMEIETTKSLPRREAKIQTQTRNTIAKVTLLADSSHKSSSDSDVVAISKKKTTNMKKASSKPVKVKDSDSDSSSSDSDFVKNHKKYSKYDKLLKVPLEKQSKDGKSRTRKGKESTETSKKTGKKSRLRKLISDSEQSSSTSSSSSGSSDSDSSDDKPVATPKKRKRIKKMSNSDDSDVKELPDTPSSKGRKNIRKLLGDQELGKETKMASVAEKERRERVKARQKLYNQVTEEGGDFGEEVTRKLVLETDPKTKEELVEVPPEIICKLKPHQVNGVKFMWECCIESLKRLESENEKGSGCVLAHCMGLGKTLQVITFVCTLLNNDRVNAKIKHVLVCCPLNTIRNWSREFEMWLESSDNDVQVFEIVDVKNVRDRADVLEHWHDSGGVMIMSYEQFRSLINGKKIPKKCRASFEKTLINPGPDIVVCDEGHVLKNESSALSKIMSKIRTRRRIVLTGTPLQNNLVEYHCMIQFVKPLLLGTKKEFQNRFINPISNGQCADSNQSDVKLMKKRVHILHKLLEGCVQRCDYNHVTKYLPPKYEFVISVRLSDRQIEVYRRYLDQFSRNKRPTNIDDEDESNTGRSGSSLFKDFTMLRLIWTHPMLLAMQKKKADIKAMFEDDSMESFIDDKSESSSSENKNADEVICLSDDAKPSTSKQGTKEGDSDIEEVVSNWKTRSRGNPDGDSESEDEGPKNDQWWNESIPEDQLPRIDLSGKILLLFEILKQCELVGDKLLLFTQSLLSLDLIEELLQRQDAEHQTFTELETGDMIGTWVNGVDYFRMDGSTGADLRKKYIDLFNNPANERARLFMISTKAGSLGTNLVGANRVVILDASWNPTHDVQAIFRVYRFGQKKPVYVYRLLAQGSMEEKIYDRQVIKQSMAFRVVDEHQIERHFNAADLEALYSFEPDSKSNRPTPMVPKDRLLAELLIKENTKDWIVTYHEHDSLLENKSEEDLTEDEKKVAWAEYEAHREGLINQDQQVSAEAEFLRQILEEDTSGELGQILGKIKEKRPNLSALQYLNYIGAFERICITKYNELLIVSQNIRKSNEEPPQEIIAQMGRVQKLVVEVQKVKKQRIQMEQMRLQQEQQRRLQQEQQRQREHQMQQQQEQFQRLLHQQRLAQQQQQFKQRPQYFPTTSSANIPYMPRMSAPRRPTVIHSNINQPNGNNMGHAAHNFGSRTYSRQSAATVVTRGPIITEAADDQPTSTTNTGGSSGPIITEID